MHTYIHTHVCAYRRWYWSQVDQNSTGTVPASIWRQGMASALQLDLPWFNIQKQMVTVDSEGHVNYKKFLDEFTVCVEVCADMIACTHLCMYVCGCTGLQRDMLITDKKFLD